VPSSSDAAALGAPLRSAPTLSGTASLQDSPTPPLASQPVLEAEKAEARPSTQAVPGGGRIGLSNVSVFYGKFRAVREVNLEFPAQQVSAIIGPSGCGKSTLIRAVNRMHEVTPGARVEGRIDLNGRNLYGSDVDVVRVRRAVGMVFQRPNPFPTMSIFDNVASGLRLGGMPPGTRLADAVEHSLRRAALWDEVKDKLRGRAVAISGGQQQRLCIARALAVEPSVLLMDEPCSALDPIATGRIEDLIRELREQVTIVIVTHNMQQAARVSDTTSFFLVDPERAGYLVETGPTGDIFSNPRERLTEDYVAGRFG